MTNKEHISIELIEGNSSESLAKVAALFQESMGYKFSDHLEKILENKNNILFVFAYIDKYIAGYKVGFETKSKYFESYNGLVSNEHRRKGLASKMMEAQHDWCKKSEFKIIDTIVAKDNKAMIIANLKGGFEINGTIWDRDSVFKILMQKIL